ncbi:MAG: hypothetical protein K2P88_01015 [Chitinophagaceae bacterium]|jgi:hypothetical protein|uniref:hypothetical protein n=1 Tax=unclassified Paraflavitalea TaxID=2798305 RepID=UPI003D334079|nr:hypothetical protein [Chitinophagaceae bacterium]
MSEASNRRQFLKLTALAGTGLSLSNTLSAMYYPPLDPQPIQNTNAFTTAGFVPNRAASWWCALEDIQWPQKQVIDKIKRRAEAFAKAGIDTAINFGFHNRFDFSNYFSQLHGYYSTVIEELHKNGVRFMDHYSCNHVSRPRSEADFKFIHKYERLAVLLFPDQKAAKFAQYEGVYFQEICEVDLRDGSRGYASQYQYEAFCHNNPKFLEMHAKYLRRLFSDVPFDGVEVDDMCSYPGNTTCGCQYCRERFKRDYGHEIPSFGDKAFFGDMTNKTNLEWGNYANPAYRDWLRMKSDSVRDHIKMIKEILGEKPLMTCCSNTGPIVLNAVALDLEKMAPYLDIFMLENVGTNILNADWVQMDAEAMHQKDIAEKRNNAPAIALSYALFEKGAYMGWALGRFWGVSNWSSTLNGRLEEDPKNALEAEDAISASNNWEKKHSDWYFREGSDLVEIRVVNNYYCRENGWRDEKGNEHWDRSKNWSIQLVRNNVGYRFVRSEELADANQLQQSDTPMVLDGVGCVSDQQFIALKSYLSKGGKAWMALPFGTHDEKGFVRKSPLSKELIGAKYKNLRIIDSSINGEPLKKMIQAGIFHPVIKQVSGDPRWSVKLRFFNKKPVLHFMNTSLEAVADNVKDLSDIPLMKDLKSPITNNQLQYEINTSRFSIPEMTAMSPELKAEKRTVRVAQYAANKTTLNVDLTGVEIYAVVQPK